MATLKTCLFSVLFIFLSMYIYAVTNKVNDKVYIGKCSKDVSRSQSYLGSGVIINKAIDKYGKDNFKKEIIVDNVANHNLLNELEKHYIQLYASFVGSIGYNLTKGGGGNFGYKPSKETRQKISDSNKGKLAYNKDIGKSVVFEGKKFTSHQTASRYFNIPRTTLNRIIESGLTIKEYKKVHCYSWDKKKKVLEIETGKIYPSSSEMGRQLNLCQVYAAEIARENKEYKGLTYKYI